MSRRCPKRNHLFLNWLRANQSLFPLQPRVIRQRKRVIYFELQGLSKVIKLIYYSNPGSWISVDAIWQGEFWDGLAYFAGGEMHTSDGWITLLAPPEKRNRYWRTREELWVELCFEAFLAWCNNNLKSGSWLEFYKGFNMTEASIHHEGEPANHFRSLFEKEMFETLQHKPDRFEKLAAEAQSFIIPLFEQSVSLSRRNDFIPEVKLPIKGSNLNDFFLHWFKTNAALFPAQPKVVRFSMDKTIDFTLIGMPDEISFSFNGRRGISVAIMHKGECWDMLGDFDVAEEHCEKGWFCRLDEEEKRQYWVTREQMWTEHCFETFLNWCTDKLAQSRYLAIYISPSCGSTWAKLLPDENDRVQEDRVTLIPLAATWLRD